MDVPIPHTPLPPHIHTRQRSRPSTARSRSRPSTAATQRLAPFSITEFSDLVTTALALEPSASLELRFPGSTTLLSPRLERKESRDLHVLVRGGEGRVRRLFSRLKTFVGGQVRRPKSRPDPATRMSMVSVFSDANAAGVDGEAFVGDAEDVQSAPPCHEPAAFEPFHPLAAQYDHRRRAPPTSSHAHQNRRSSVISTSSPPASESTHSHSLAHSTISCSRLSNSFPPPSPTASIFSSVGSASGSAWHASVSECSNGSAGYLSSDSNSFLATPASARANSFPLPARPWSSLTVRGSSGSAEDDAGFGPLGPGSGLGLGAPYAYDPFAKGTVRVVHHSYEALPAPTTSAYATAQHQQSPQRARHRAASRRRGHGHAHGARTRVGSTINEMDVPASARERARTPPEVPAKDWTLDLGSSGANANVSRPGSGTGRQSVTPTPRTRLPSLSRPTNPVSSSLSARSTPTPTPPVLASSSLVLVAQNTHGHTHSRSSSTGSDALPTPPPSLKDIATSPSNTVPASGARSAGSAGTYPRAALRPRTRSRIPIPVAMFQAQAGGLGDGGASTATATATRGRVRASSPFPLSR
ncbi:hypothetical protein HMN09_01183300 [Mycena chlorophos]|uniref:Uncharacterized protein n=1 Tax=Mycena chlorophos TaxID=658473 RepID=A0A8H6S7L3_MYCCL|nr:hypothetical protein HMN09_01183300 [Mycena chlorophos]